MEISYSDLQTRYAAMEETELLQLAAERDELTDLAQDALLREMRNRRLAVPDAVTIPKPEPVHPDAKIVTIRRFMSLTDALPARAAVEAAGVACFLRDENAVRTAWHLTGAFGGTRLDVLEEDRAAAEAALLQVDAAEAAIPIEDGAEGMLGEDYLCPSCGSIEVNRLDALTGLGTMTGWLLGRRIKPENQRWRCNDCKAEWIDNERE